MACERWCFNRGCDAARRRWPYVLLLTLCALGSSLAVPETDPSYYSYTGLSRAESSIDYSPSSFSFLPAEEESSLIRNRRSSVKQLVSSDAPQHDQPASQQQPTQQHQQSQQPQTPLPQQHQQQTQTPAPQQPPLVNATSNSNVSYTTETGAVETHGVQTTTELPVPVNSSNPEPKPKKPTVIVSNPLNPSTEQPMAGTIWANRTMWPNATSNKTPPSPKNNDRIVGEVVEPAPAEKEKEKTESDVSDIAISKFSEKFSNKLLTQNNITKTEVDTHQYYNSTFIVDEAVGKECWVDIDNHPDLRINVLLSQSHRRAATVKLTFDFPFYGHKVRNITIATGGFLYTGEYVHSWLAATQYIAPLMANFDTRISNESYVKYADNGTAFTVEWKKVVLQDKPDAGPFTFQVTLHNTGDIVFVYSAIPLIIENIEDTAHPVKVGLSDAYIMDRTVFLVRRKTIYEYHRVNFNRQDIRNWTVIYLRALPTCLQMDNCKDCLTKITEFECKWCSELTQCSTGTFRSRQDWLYKGCDIRHIKEKDKCPATAITYKENDQTYDYNGHVRTMQDATGEAAVKKKRPGASPIEHSRDNMNMGVSGIIGILLIVALIAGLAGWAAYAYRNPHSASGQMLIRYRPSQWSWRRGEARYTAATIHM